MSLTIGFVGLGAMGMPMAANLARAGHHVLGFDIDSDRVGEARHHGISPVLTPREAADGADVLITMLPDAETVRRVILVDDGPLAALERGCLMIDCSTTDLATARLLADRGAERGVHVLDAPVAGTVGGAIEAVLTFVVGGSELANRHAEHLFKVMGARVLYCGASGAGQIARACNQLVFAATLAAVSEAFVLAERSGLSPQKLFDVLSEGAGNSYALNNFCPLPGIVGFAPANYGYRARLSAVRLRDELRAATAAADLIGVPLSVGTAAQELVELLADSDPDIDCSAVIKVVDTATSRT
ncbi:3-hydroxyisobutyrate dehydrogenase [Mycolicibacterium murale]|uniref:3-hydroxyisobutyrate dehydrogenase n=1 Tax=Mycolicibacterium murale TaxID=182220 RepID=A0A7I9WNE9_9MYCO|nr:NAD(P)-binding domain-containing protein [Mycolicibacterium murale]MCV7185923.1 NAD-binding protein [Mycolicibacterium murale]GFG58776.1 3-hydroxyisobutyrate dehydrogenase [Mycolicibacterium murale]